MPACKCILYILRSINNKSKSLKILVILNLICLFLFFEKICQSLNFLTSISLTPNNCNNLCYHNAIKMTA